MMNETEKYIRALLQQQGIAVPQNFETLLRTFAQTEDNINHVKSIRLLQETMTTSWQLIARREEINTMQVALPNGIAGKPYTAHFSFTTYGLADITASNLTGFEGSGLEYNPKTKIIQGLPKRSGDIVLNFSYNFEGEPQGAPVNTRKITIIINPDPKSLWKNIPSNAEDAYAKADDVAETASFLGKTLVAVSKRGRSHANNGGFRDDDYAFAKLPSGWGIIAISDGAGSASCSRKGSQLACNAVIDYFRQNFTTENTTLLDAAISSYPDNASIKNKVQDIAHPYLLAAAKKAYADIAAFATSINTPVSDFHATLAFVLVKQYGEGYAFFSFGVGDCPIVLADTSFKWVKPLNTLDVGEYGGGTRFITMPEIFTNAAFEGRFNFEYTASFPHLVLMTDGVYDPKFEVEANLIKTEKWQAFFDDLAGNNPEGITVLLEAGNATNTERLSEWMDFWSPGNHDDRTLLLIF
jgi:hypothetical protein